MCYDDEKDRDDGHWGQDEWLALLIRTAGYVHENVRSQMTKDILDYIEGKVSKK